MATNAEPQIIPSQLKQARESLALTLDEVSASTNIKSEDIVKWEEGNGTPSIEQLWLLAEKYHRSTDYFLRHTSVLPKQLNFRLTKQKILNDLPPQAREAIVRFEELCRAEAELERLLNKQQRVSLEKIAGDITPEELSIRERAKYGLGEKPIKDLRKLLSNAGVRIFMLPISDKKLSGLSCWYDEYGPCILINSYDEPLGRRTFTLAHEYAHLLVGHTPVICDLEYNAPEERYANSFASNFLIPAYDLADEFEQIVGEPDTLPNNTQIAKLASRYHVSLEALSRRLEELRLISPGSTDKYIRSWSSKPRQYRGAKGARWKRQLGEKYVSLALEAHSNGRVSLGKLAQYLGVDIRTALTVSEENGKIAKR